MYWSFISAKSAFVQTFSSLLLLHSDWLPCTFHCNKYLIVLHWDDVDSLAHWSSCPPPAQWRMNGLSLSELCCLFCCPPCPSRIAAKLAFLPPEPTYTFLPDPEAGPNAPGGTGASSLRARGGGASVAGGAGTVEGRWKLHLTERAEFQYSQRELDTTEVFLTRSSRGNRVGCMYIRCVPNARWVYALSSFTPQLVDLSLSFCNSVSVPQKCFHTLFSCPSWPLTSRFASFTCLLTLLTSCIFSGSFISILFFLFKNHSIFSILLVLQVCRNLNVEFFMLLVILVYDSYCNKSVTLSGKILVLCESETKHFYAIWPSFLQVCVIKSIGGDCFMRSDH